MLNTGAGIKLVHVPYKGVTNAFSDLLGGQISIMFPGAPIALPQVKAGKLRALGASSAKRSAAAPDVPTLNEQGVPDFDLVAWFMMYAPAATPAPVLARLREASAQVMANPEVVAKLGSQGLELRSMKSDELSSFGRAEIIKWADLVKRSGAQID